MISRTEYLAERKARREAILDAIRGGTSYRKIGEQFGISGARVAQIASKAGISRRAKKAD